MQKQQTNQTMLKNRKIHLILRLIFVFFKKEVAETLFYLQKKESMRRVILFFVLSVLISCRKEMFSGTSGNINNLVPDTIYRVTAIHYPGADNWRKDKYNKDQLCYLVMYENGVKKFYLKVDNKALIGSAPDKHRIRNGELYTDFCNSSGTFIGKNGMYLFSYPEKEVICGFAVEGEDVYTLGLNCSGKGISFRKNGEVIFKDENSVPLSYDRTDALRKDASGFIFSFRKNVGTSEHGDVYVYSEGEAKRQIKTDNVMDILYATEIDGELLQILKISENMFPVFRYRGQDYFLAIKDPITSFTRFDILKDGNIYIVAEAACKGSFLNILWCFSENKLNLENKGMNTKFFLKNGFTGMMSKFNDGTYVFQNKKNKKSYNERIRNISPLCISFEGEEVVFAVNPESPEKSPCIILGDKKIPYPIRGYITGISIEIR